MTPIITRPHYRLSLATQDCKKMGINVRLFQSFPQAQRPREQEILNVTMKPEEIHRLSMELLKIAL